MSPCSSWILHRRRQVQRAPNPETTAVQHMRVHHRRPNITMHESLRHGANVVARLQQVRSGRVAESVAGHPLVELCDPRRAADLALQHALMQMVATTLACDAIAISARRRKDPLPRPTARRPPPRRYAIAPPPPNACATQMVQRRRHRDRQASSTAGDGIDAVIVGGVAMVSLAPRFGQVSP